MELEGSVNILFSLAGEKKESQTIEQRTQWKSNAISENSNYYK